MSRRFNWVHLSDIHYNFQNYQTEKMRDELIVYLQKLRNEISFDVLVVTGDITYQGGTYKSELYAFLQSVLNSVNLDKDKLCIIPGNHDIKRSEHRETLLKGILNSSDPYEKVNALKGKTYKDLIAGQKAFCTFYKKILGEDYPDTLHHIKQFEHFNIVHVNTCFLSGMDKEESSLIIGQEKFYHVAKELRNTNEEKVNIAIAHHTLDCLDEQEQQLLENNLNDCNIDIFLCGHMHKPKYSFRSDNTRTIPMFTCGAGVVDKFAEPCFITGWADLDQKTGEVTYHSWQKKNQYWCIDNTIGRRLVNGVLNFKLERFLKTSAEQTFETRDEIARTQQDKLIEILTNELDRAYDFISKNLISEAINSLGIVFKKVSVSEKPKLYARARLYEGMCYDDLSIINSSDKEDNLKKSLIAYHECLKVYTAKNDPEKYSAVLNNIGAIYSKLASIRGIEINLTNALEAYNKSLEFTQDRFSYGQTISNIGNVYSILAQIREDNTYLLKAINLFAEALTIMTELNDQGEINRITFNKAKTHIKLSSIEKRKENVEKAVLYLIELSKKWTLEIDPIQYADIQKEFGNAYSSLALVEGASYYQKAIQAYTEALRIYSASTKNQITGIKEKLGNVYLAFGRYTERIDYLKQAIELYNGILIDADIIKFPLSYAQRQINLAAAYIELSKYENQLNNLEHAKHISEEALKIYTNQEYPIVHAEVLFNIGNIYLETSTYFKSADYLDKCIELGVETIRLYGDKNNYVFIAEVEAMIGHAYAFYHQYKDGPECLEESIKHYQRSIYFFEKAVQNCAIENSHKSYYGVLTDIGISLMFLSKFKDTPINLHNALDSLLQAQLICNKVPDSETGAKIKFNLGRVYSCLYRLDPETGYNYKKNAQEFLEEALIYFSQDTYLQEAQETRRLLDILN